jgi:D-3-phosphoglycerate dehydrogenase
MTKVVITQRLHEDGMALLEKEGVEAAIAGTGNPKEYAPLLKDAQGLIIRIGSIDRAAMQGAPGLRVIGRPGVGVDDVDVAAATELGIPVVVVPGANTRSVAEHGLMLLFALAKDMPRSDRETRKGNFNIRNSFKAIELKSRTLGLIGCGAIGSEFARMASAIGMGVLVYDPFVAAENIAAQGWRHTADLNEVFSTADAVSLHVPLTDETRNLVGGREIGLMKPTAILINCARGGIVDETALYAALKENRIHGAGFDVLAKEPFDADNPLMTLNNFIVTPHMAGQTREAASGVATGAVRGVLAVIAGEKWPKVANPGVYEHPRWKA